MRRFSFFVFVRNRRGAAAIEFAILAPVFVLLLIGLLEFGRALHLRNALNDAADRAQRMVLIDREVALDSIRASVVEAFRGAQVVGPFLSEAAIETDGVFFRRISITIETNLLLPSPLGRSLTMNEERLVLLREQP